MSKGYNGYTNYETWLVSLHINNDEQSQNYWCREARNYLRDFEGPDDARWHLAEALKDDYLEGLAAVKAQGVYADLLHAALSDVNWQEIAGNMVEDAQEEVPHAG